MSKEQYKSEGDCTKCSIKWQCENRCKPAIKRDEHILKAMVRSKNEL